MEHFVVIYSTTCLKNTANNCVGDVVNRVACIFASDLDNAKSKFLTRFRNSVKHNPVFFKGIIPVDTFCYILDDFFMIPED